jgi:hypothetical protein
MYPLKSQQRTPANVQGGDKFRFKQVFQGPHTTIQLLMVDSNWRRVLKSLKAIYKAGAHGVILLSRDPKIKHEHIIRIYEIARKWYPRWWIGANLSDACQTRAAIKIPSTASALWLSNIGINSANNLDPYAVPEFVKHQRHKRKLKTLLFGGFSLKDPERIDRHLITMMVTAVKRKYVDIIVLGNEKGSPPSVQVIEEVRAAVGDFPLAIVGRMRPGDILKHRDAAGYHRLLYLVDCFIPCSPYVQSHAHSTSNVEEFMRITLAMDPNEQPPSQRSQYNLPPWRVRKKLLERVPFAVQEVRQELAVAS